MFWFYYLVKAIIKILLLLLTNCQVRGRKNIPRKGPVLVVANHLHLADPPVIGVCLTRKVAFMAKEELFRYRIFGYLIQELGAFPVHRGQLDRKALRQAERVLAEGRILAIFPEATRSQNAQLQPAFSGAALIALRSGAPILPVAITGSERLTGAWWLRRPRLTVNIGRPFNITPVNSRLNKGELAELTDEMMRKIAELLPLEYQGEYKTEEQSDGVRS